MFSPLFSRDFIINSKGEANLLMECYRILFVCCIIRTLEGIGDMMDAFKSITTVEYIRAVKNLGWETFNGKLWQRNYYEHIIHDHQSYETISNYIINNPAKWPGDKFYFE